MPRQFVREVDIKMRKVLAGFQPKLPVMMQPSSSACFENGRSSGGASAYLAQKYSDLFESELSNAGRGILLMMDYTPTYGTKCIYGIPYPELSGLLTVANARLFAYQFQVLGNDERDYEVTKQRSLLVDDGPDNVCCRVAGVKEPAKVRTVTAGEALPYWLTRSFQKDVHAYIRQIPQFSLCGQPLEAWHLKFLDRLSSEFGLFQGFTFDGERTVWVSGDYSAATDEIDIRLTRICHGIMMEKLMTSYEQQGCDPETILKYRYILDACIEPHLVHYPHNYQASEELRTCTLRPEDALLGRDMENLNPCVQQNGQLMGSTLSFPILCIVNFCVSWLALFPHVEDFRKIPILVNGDDILFRCRESQYAVWCDHVKNAGFRKSLGKNFAHEDKIFINSQPWVARKRSDFDVSGLCEFDYCPFFNTGLMHGQSKVASQMPIETDESQVFKALYTLQPEAVKGAQNRERAVRRFHSVNREHLRLVSANGFFSFHAAREFYGLGMVPSEKAQYTKFQRIIANVCIQSGLELSKQGKLYIGDGRCFRATHDLSRIQGRRMLYRGCLVPPESVKPPASGFTILKQIDQRELLWTQDVVTEGDDAMFCSARALSGRLRKAVSKLRVESRGRGEILPYPERLMRSGFCQRPYSEDPAFIATAVSA